MQSKSRLKSCEGIRIREGKRSRAASYQKKGNLTKKLTKTVDKKEIDNQNAWILRGSAFGETRKADRRLRHGNV